MNNSIPVNEWVSVPNTWKLNSLDSRICRKFVFYHFRPYSFITAFVGNDSGVHSNETIGIKPGQISLIANYKSDYFQCLTVTSIYVNNIQRKPLSDLLAYRKHGQAKFWHLSALNFFQGDFEVFNGPNPLDLTKI